MTKDTQADGKRAYFLYRFLLLSLSTSYNAGRTTSAASAANRVGDKELRKIIRHLNAAEDSWLAATSSQAKATKVTTGRLVRMLSALRKSLEEDYLQHVEPYNRVLTAEDTLTALYQLIELTPEEKSQLGLPTGDGLTLLKQTLLNLEAKGGLENYENIFSAYKEAVGLDFSREMTTIDTLDGVDAIIEETVRSALAYLPERRSPSRKSRTIDQGKDITIQDLSRKAQREIRRLLARSGNTQAFLQDGTTKHPYIRRYLHPAYIKKLTLTLVENERLTDRLPVYLTGLTIEACGPLPFSDTDLGNFESDKSYPPLLNKDLQGLDGSSVSRLGKEIPGPSDYELASQGATRITLEFYIKVPQSYEGKTETFRGIVASQPNTSSPTRRVDFAFSSTGIGGTLSHIIKVMNTTLLSGIACLDDFFPIAHDITSTQTIIRDSVASPVWAHSLVQLCRKEAVGRALWAFQDNAPAYSEFSFGDPIGQGDFCGFDFLLAQAHASLQARLKAIRNSGTDPESYIEQLCEKTELQVTLRQAWRRLKRYPFSSMAMIGVIHRNIIGDVFGQDTLELNSPQIHFDAYLSITEVLLDEGAHIAAAKYLKKLRPLNHYVERGLGRRSEADIDSSNSCEIFSGNLVVRYLICLATYYYLFDEHKDRDRSLLPAKFYQGVTRLQLVEEAWKTLEQAQNHIHTRLKKYMVIGEVSQGTFYPHYALLARLYFMRAKLMTFFPRLVPRDERSLPTENFDVGDQRTKASIHWGRLYLLEKARLYAAADGNSDRYSSYAAIQSCLYLAAAYENSNHLTIHDTKLGQERVLKREDCLEWAKTLRDHALIAYANTGRQCYYAIKEKSGMPRVHDEYGHYRIDKIPAIFEARGLDNHLNTTETSPQPEESLVLNISLLAVNIADLPKLTPKHPTESIYLFGTNACYLFLARGLYLLCSDTQSEFKIEKGRTKINWRKKLSLAQRLLDMAWAIAEDGCNIKKEKGKGVQRRTITRSFSSNEENDYSSAEINSVRDLYPHRISEIADLGKVFTAACLVLRAYAESGQTRQELIEDLHKLLPMLHGEYKLRRSPTLQALLAKQKRFNGQLQDYLTQTTEILQQNLPTVADAYSPIEIKRCRDRLLQSLFAALIESNPSH